MVIRFLSFQINLISYQRPIYIYTIARPLTLPSFEPGHSNRGQSITAPLRAYERFKLGIIDSIGMSKCINRAATMFMRMYTAIRLTQSMYLSFPNLLTPKNKNTKQVIYAYISAIRRAKPNGKMVYIKTGNPERSSLELHKTIPVKTAPKMSLRKSFLMSYKAPSASFAVLQALSLSCLFCQRDL